MTTLDQIKAELATLTEKVYTFLTSQDENATYHFTKEQLEEFVIKIGKKYLGEFTSQVEDISFDEDIVSLDLSYNNQINIDIDSSQIRDEINRSVDVEGLEFETIGRIYNEAKKLGADMEVA